MRQTSLHKRCNIVLLRN